MSIKILVAAHKPYRMPDDALYCPVQVGKALSSNTMEGFVGDDTGENISAKNPFYSELTALYWGWKNLPSDCTALGLAHYRRHFSSASGTNKKKDVWDCVLTQSEAEALLDRAPIILPKKRHYYIETLASHYGHTHDPVHLQKTRKILEKIEPEYMEAFDRVMKRRSAHMFNMFVMQRPLADAYCTWLFRILFALEEEIDPSLMSRFDARLFGRVSELLLDVWLEKNGYDYVEIPFLYMEPVNWSRKIRSFLQAKFGRKRYDQSF